MVDRLDPLAAASGITRTYHRYVRSLVRVRDRKVADAFDHAVERGTLVKGPLLEATPPYRSGCTLRDLIDEGVLDAGFARFDSPALPLDRALHLHQEHAVRKGVAGRSIVVTTGTGSGKTESFLIPILNRLAQEKRAGSLGPGVRALLLYPMNALANDQVKRLRQLLAVTPEFTFGRYTGETRESVRDASQQFSAQHPGAEPLPNEMLSRTQMRMHPPHILLTNYAMLEYLLLRPADLELFEGDSWTFIALDEAHVYDGAKGAEIGMLLRRLRQRVARDRPIQSIATSASLEGTPDQVMSFARNIFGSNFEWAAGDTDRQDLVTATRLDQINIPTWGPIGAKGWLSLLNAPLDKREVLIERFAADHGITAMHRGDALLREHHLVALRSILVVEPQDAASVADRLFADADSPRAALDALVEVASGTHTSDGNPLLSARYHLFLRATEGAFTCLSTSGPHVELGRHEECPTCHAAAFEFGACNRCGVLYLAGKVERRGSSMYFGRKKSNAALTWLMLDENTSDVVDEDEAALDEGKAVAASTASLCTSCSRLGEADIRFCAGCAAPTRVVRRLENPTTRLGTCLHCGARASEVVRRLNSGSDATPAVLATELYRNLPPSEGLSADFPGAGRKLLMFSDSRQNAAFAAPYLQNSYGRIQQRRLLAIALETADGEEVSFQDLVDLTLARAKGAGFFEASQTFMTQRNEIRKWLSTELVATDQRQSLEGVGLLEVTHLRTLPLPPALGRLGLDEPEAWALIEELTRSLRLQAVMTMPDGVDPKDPIFSPRLGPNYVRLDGSDSKRRVVSWRPTSGINRRIDYLHRVLAAVGADRKNATIILERIWTYLLQADWLARSAPTGLGTVLQDNHAALRLQTGDQVIVYECGQCRQLTHRSVRGTCPTMRCEGTLVRFELPPADMDEAHYRRLYRTFDPVPLTAREHTAQWTSDKAAEIQQEFVQGRINVLSSSTTFELGVDVGDLQAVLLRNMPPKTANYVQRAGRAGRRASSAALVVTHAQRRSHDLSRFQEPTKMIAGVMRVPVVPLDNERIGRRHAHSIAMAAYFRRSFQQDGRSWSQAGQFFLADDNAGRSPAEGVRSFLTPVPGEVLDALRTALPAKVQQLIGVEDGNWVSVLCELLEQVRADLVDEVQRLQAREVEFAKTKNYRMADQMTRTLRTVRERQLLGYLGSRNVIPKYGFPVDTVELRTSHADTAAGAQLELSRDLTQAIYDYAPGNQVIAGGRKWTSRGIHRLPGKDLVVRQYRLCNLCGFFVTGPDIPSACGGCNEIPTASMREFIVPEFGFVCDMTTADVGTEPPERRWQGVTVVENLGEEVKSFTWNKDRGSIPGIQGRAGARGVLVALSEGYGAGYSICQWCGWGEPVGNKAPPKWHARPRDGEKCTGFLERRTLGHRFETDMLELRFPGMHLTDDDETSQWLSLQFALVEGASDALDISRDDLDGSLSWSPDGSRTIVLYDTVPGGAGGARLIADSLDEMLRGALARVTNCDCGIETSCYGCLRGYRNSKEHDRLTRSGALAGLHQLLGKTSNVGHS